MQSDLFRLINPRPEHFQSMQDLSLRVYPFSPPWNSTHLFSHQKMFREGQFIIWDSENQKTVAMAFCLIIDWDDYEIDANWKEFTDGGMFTNHDPNGRTLYGAEIMVDPEYRGKGLAKRLYNARFDLTRRLKLRRIRAGARLPGYVTYSKEFTPIQYVGQVVQGKIFDPTLSFQLKQGFKVLSVVKGYLSYDPESLGNAAVIEWLNMEQATPELISSQKQRMDSLQEKWKVGP
ncbi:MAG: GNAT family N-acetyltransferase [Bdellovibrionales bacterium]|nr:GNAT family N-acetyltransferase [Bdellovibrionales bacterium]